ncbi:hypothetical protein [uncultured Legionella sp.]|uniref:hypothetical protein n=1 Tax=uncultured Legionella sp. TaxID=210934 RepID=UPI00261AA7C5|nr:hypothetical protein [uncultured Legionella sp.]
MTNEKEKAGARAKCDLLQAAFAKGIDNFEELLLKKKVIPVITDNKQNLLKKGFRTFVLDELGKYPEYIDNRDGLLDIESWYFWETSIIFRFKESSKTFRFNELLPFIHADDAKNFFAQATAFDASIFCLENPEYSTQIQALEKEKKIKPHDLDFVCFLPIMVKLDRGKIFEFLAQAYLMIYQNMPVTAFNNKPLLRFREVFHLVKGADIEAEAKGFFIQKMIGISFKWGINKACFIWEVLDLAKQYDLLHLVQEELATNSALDLKQLEAIFKQYSINYQEFFPETGQDKHYII